MEQNQSEFDETEENLRHLRICLKPLSSTINPEVPRELNNDPYSYRKMPISEFVDLKSMFNDPWAELMADLEDKKNAQKPRTVANDSSVDIKCEKYALEDSSTTSTSDGATMNISSSYEEISDIKMLTDKAKDFYKNKLTKPTNLSRLSTDSVFMQNNFDGRDFMKDSTGSINQRLSTDKISDLLSSMPEPGDLIRQLSTDSILMNNDFYGCDLIRNLNRTSSQRLTTDEISDFLSHISESSDLSHLSTDSVFIRVNDTSRQTDTSVEKVQTILMKYIGFIERITNATMNMFYKLKNYLWQK
ncbi:uncharacterized protein LOC100679948 [Nasonia vitripennis]|uniref:Uncharacterized protein n=1 Tax=Nasonia vitripennis TaxID=7425 RepID=A0A7M7GCL0_NASVI|nr:uncharacterized protein LOC100679948 [Nasonia vitripennis]